MWPYCKISKDENMTRLNVDAEGQDCTSHQTPIARAISFKV